jgi:hypothetical protein
VKVDKGTGDHAIIHITTNGQAPVAETATERSALKGLHARLHGDASQPTGTMKLRTPGPDNQMLSGLIFLDGVRIDAAAFRRLDPTRFKSVEILKGPTATKLYSDPAAANGVIQITTK